MEDKIKHHMALAFFGSAYAEQAEECQQSLSGEIMDQLPSEIDPAAIRASETLTLNLLKDNGVNSLAEIMLKIELIQEDTGITGDRELIPEMLGHYLAMQAMGHGVGLYDAFGSSAEKVIRVPYMEFSSCSLELDYFQPEYCDKCFQRIEECECNAIYSVAPYLIDRAYGGPQEGGWWYDCGVPQLSEDLPLPVYVVGREEAYKARDKMRKQIEDSGINKDRRDIGSVLSEGILDACVNKGHPKHWPEFKPIYE